MRAFLLSPLDAASWRALLAILAGFLVAIVSFGLLSFLFSTGGSLLIWLVGIPIVGLGIEVSRLAAQVERRRIAWVDGIALVAHPYRPYDGLPHSPYGPWLRAWAETEFLDPRRWRDVLYVLVLLPLAVIELVVALTLWGTAVGLVSAPLVVGAMRSAGWSGAPAFTGGAAAAATAVAVIVGLLLFPVAASACRGLMVLHRAVVEGFLCVSATEALRQDVERLRGSRSAAIELEASELRRIERDLHDGAQQRLVALAIDLGLAEERIGTDPAAAATLVASARTQARLALAELRDLVRGTAPAILLDRGLAAAIGSVAGGCPVPTSLDGSLGPEERLPAAVERAAYFVVTEALAKVAKHSEATQCEVELRREPARLLVRIRDDGSGGAAVLPGGGLAGLRDRVEGLDGTMRVESPPGGPTLVEVIFPLPAA